MPADPQEEAGIHRTDDATSRRCFDIGALTTGLVKGLLMECLVVPSSFLAGRPIYIPRTDGATSWRSPWANNTPWLRTRSAVSWGRDLVSASCLHLLPRGALLDVAKLVKRLGPDQDCIIYCQVCRLAGRDDRNLQFTNHALNTGNLEARYFSDP